MKQGEGLPTRQERFVVEYPVDLNATLAAIRAGYSAKTAASQGSRLLRNVKISEAIQAGIAKRSAKTELTAEWVLNKLVENVEKAMQAVPVLDREGEPTGEYTYQGAVANQALALLGKHLALFPDKLSVDFRDVAKLSDEELNERRKVLRLVA